MSFREAVAQAFAPDGALARCVEAFSPRPGQTTMATAVAATLEDGGVLVVEAGTGVGKTFAYLVPALLSGERVLLSTATKTLQDQLFGRDIPRLLAALGVPARIALLKGRSSYLCNYRLESARHDLRAMHPMAQEDLAHIEVWATGTSRGDLAELPQLDERSPVIPLVTSTRENCLGSRCAHVQSCHVNQARREALAADVVVVNHHLFFADLNIRESGVAELLPSVRCVVFDEAHQLNAIGVQFLGRQISTAQLDALGRDLARQGPSLALVAENWPEMVTQLTRETASLRELCTNGSPDIRAPWIDEAPVGLDRSAWCRALDALQLILQQWDLMLGSLEEQAPDIHGLRERTSTLIQALQLFNGPIEPGWVRWMDVGRQQVRLVHSPLDVGPAMRSRVIGQAMENGSRKSWIFTSATLGHDASLSTFVQSCGLNGAQVLQVPSPFDYAHQAWQYVPSHMPKPADARHSASVAELVAHAATVLGGRTLVLTTTLRAMRDIAAVLRQHFSASGTLEVLLQGEAPKRELTERFIQGAGQGGDRKGCVLVASASFWEGVDVSGDALQLVVIDKLPFAPPDDPLVQARARQIEAAGKRPFAHLHVPEAAIALKQGAGRLIRRETDRGILVVCDVRLTHMGYGRRIQAALPAMQSITTQGQFTQVLQGLTRFSTTDCQ